MAEGNHHHSQAELEKQAASHKEQVERLKADHEAEVAELRRQLGDSRTEFERVLTAKLDAKKQELLSDFEQRLAVSNASWETKLADCQTELIDKHQQEIEQINALHSEELKNAVRAKELEYEACFQSGQAMLKALHSEAEDALRSECESKISALEGELLAIEEQYKVEVTANKADLEEAHARQLLEIKVSHQEEIATVVSEFEQIQKNSEAKHTQAIEELKEKNLQMEKELKAAHELLETHSKELEAQEKEKAELILQHQSHISELELSHSKKLSEVKEEAIKEAIARPSPRLQSPRRVLTMSEDDPVDIVQSDSVLLANPSKIQQFRAQFQQKRDTALAQQRERSPAQQTTDVQAQKQDKSSAKQREEDKASRRGGSPTRQSPQRKESPTASGSLAKLKAEYESMLTQQRSKLESERKTQVDLLVGKHKKDVAKLEQKFKFELDESQAAHAAEVEKIHTEHASRLAQLRSEHTAVTDALKAQHMSELETLTTQYVEQVETLRTRHGSEIEEQSAHYTADTAQYAAELETLTSQHTAQIRALREQHDRETATLQSQDSTLESKLRDLRAELVQEHMTKFKEMTEKLQEAHQTELGSVRRERDNLAATHEQRVQLLRAEFEAGHEQEVGAVVERHKNEMRSLREEYEARLRQAEIDHAHRLRAVVGQHEAKEDQSEQLEQTVRQELSRVTQDLETRLQCMEEERQQFTDREALLRVQLEQALNEGNKTREEVDQLTAMLQAREMEAVRREQAVSEEMSRQSATLSTLQAERDVLQSTVRALYGAVVNSLELSSLIHSVLGDQHLLVPATPTTQPDHTHSQPTLDESVSGLSERLLGQQECSPGGSGPAHSTESTPTPQLPYPTPHPPPLTLAPSTAGLPLQRSTDWTDLKQTPSVDSGIISQQTSVLHSDGSTLVGTPSAVTVTTPPSLSTPTADAPPDLSIVPLDTTVTAPHTHTQDHRTVDLDDTGQSFLSVSLMTPTGSPTHPPLDPHSMEDHDESLQSLTEQPLIDLSVLPLDNSTLLMDQSPLPLPPVDQSDTTLPLHASSQPSLQEHPHSANNTPHGVLPYTVSSGLPGPAVSMGATTETVGASMLDLPDLPLLHSQLTAFHSAVGSLVQRYAMMVEEPRSQALVSQLQSQLDSLRQAHKEQQTRLEESEDREREKEQELARLKDTEYEEPRSQALQSQLDSLRQAHKEQQIKLEESEDREREKEQELRVLQEELTERLEQLEAAEAKLKALVQQLEGCDHRLDEAGEKDAKGQLEVFEKELGEKNELIEQLKFERETLSEKVNELSAQVETQEESLTHTNTEMLHLKQECQALKQVNRQLRDKQEQADLRVCTMEGRIAELKASYEAQLRQKQEELIDLQDVRDRLSAKEEAEERLLLEREELVNRLSVAEHQLATHSERWREGERLAEKEQRLLSQLKSQEQLSETLRARLQEAQSSLHLTQQECAQFSAGRAQLQLELHQLSQEFQHKETLLQATLSEKSASEKHLENCQKELEAVKEELKATQEARDEACHELEEVKGQMVSISQISTDQDSTHSLDHTHQQTVPVSDGSHDEEGLRLESAGLENRVAELEQEIRDKEEQHHQQCLILEQELARMRQQLTEHAQQLELHRAREQRAGVEAEESKETEAQLRNALNDVSQKLSLESHLKESLSKEVSTLREEVERGQRSCEQLLTEAKSKHEQEVQTLVSEHAQKLSDLQLAHLEALQQQSDELEAKHTGEMTFLKLHHQEQLENLHIRHTEEVERLLSDQQALLLTLGGAGGQQEDDFTDVGGPTEDALLLKIAELAPILAREAQEVNELCQQTGQRELFEGECQPDGQVSPLESLVERLREVIQDIGAAKDASGVEDWRKELLQSVEALLDHQRGVLANTLSASIREEGGDSDQIQGLLQDQLSQHNGLVQQLYSADRESLLAEIRALRATLDTMRQEQKQQNEDLLAQLRLSQPTDSTHLQDQLQSALAKLTLLQRELSEKNRELNEKARQEQEVDVARQRLAEVEGSLARAQAEATALKQSELDQASRTIEELRNALREREKEVNTMSSQAQEEVTSLKAALQSKENQLTQTTDKLLQEKLLSSQVSGEVRALKDEVSNYQREIEVCQQRLQDLDLLRERMTSLQRENSDLQSKVELSELEQMHLNTLKEESDLKHRELVASLQDQLRRSKLLRSTTQITDAANINEQLEALLQQEQLHLLSHNSLKADKELLEREIRGLKEEIEAWKNLVKNPSTDMSHPGSRLAQNKFTHGIPLSESGAEQSLEYANSKIARLYALYRQAESHRKALVFQKRYLVCQVDAFYQTQEAALQMMADMGAPVEITSFRVSCSKTTRPCTRFRTIGKVVLATLRFQYVRRRKIEYLQAKISKFSPSPSVATKYSLSPSQVTAPLPSGEHTHSTQPPHLLPTSSVVHESTTNTSHPLISREHPTVSQPASRGQSISSSEMHSASKSKLTKKPEGSSLKHHRVVSESHKGSSTSKPAKRGGQRSTVKQVSPVMPGAPSLSTGDTQLMAYIKGLEKLQARLSKTKP